MKSAIIFLAILGCSAQKMGTDKDKVKPSHEKIEDIKKAKTRSIKKNMTINQ